MRSRRALHVVLAPWRRAETLLFAVCFAFLAIAAVLPCPAAAHGDEAPAAGPAVSPRAEARMGDLEVLAVYRPAVVPIGGLFSAGAPPRPETLALFVTRYADGAPVAHAEVEAGGDLESLPLVETDPGVYVTHDLMISSGRTDLKVSVKLPGAEPSVQTLALLVPGGAATATAAAAPAAGRVSPVAIGLAALAAYGVMTLVFLAGAGGRPWRRLWPARRAASRVGASHAGGAPAPARGA